MELAARRPVLTWSRNACDVSLGDLIDEARHSLFLELEIPMATARPPETTSLDGHGDRVPDEREGSWIGYTLSAPLQRRLGHPEGWGNTFPVARALDDLRGWCRGRHIDASAGPWTDHQADVDVGPQLQRPLCSRLAWYVVAWRMTPTWAARQERLTTTTTTRLLGAALRHAFEKRRDWAFAPGSGVPQVLAADRRQRRADRLARTEAAAVAAAIASTPGLRCRYCGELYDPYSEAPCPGSEGNQASAAEAAALAEAGVTLLCSPSR